MFALVRTSSVSKAQHGITFVLIDMATPGISRRPISTIAGDDEFAEVFFDDVVVPLGNVVGEVDRGWQVATAVLAEERLRIGSPALALKALERLRMMLRSSHRLAATPALLERADDCEVAVETLIAAYLSAAEAAEQGVAADSSYLKVLVTEAVHMVLDVTQQLTGPAGALRFSEREGSDLLDYSEMYLQSRRLTIYGGSNEVQRNIIATRVLGLPLAGSKP
jgi:alkylation response protein AidB-like acyl-CoA dehydrogenase